jgi:hypothetical protein
VTIQAAGHHPYVAQRSAELRFSLYRGTHPANRAWVLAEKSARLGPWRIRAQVVGASHVVVISREAIALTEVVVACPVHAEAPAAIQTLPALAAHPVEVDLGEWQYTHAARRVASGSGEEAISEDAWCSDVPNRLSASYPAGPDGRRGFTALTWREEGLGLRLETLHVYPEEDAVVATVTRCSTKE